MHFHFVCIEYKVQDVRKHTQEVVKADKGRHGNGVVREEAQYHGHQHRQDRKQKEQRHEGNHQQIKRCVFAQTDSSF